MKPNWKDAPEWANYLAMDGDADYLHIRFQTPRGGRLVSVTLEFAED